MTKRAIRVKVGEDLSDSTVCRVISLLEAENPISKKEACNILNISYNTTRLARIIEVYDDKIKFAKAQRKALIGVPVTDNDAVYILQEYLAGEPLSTISDSTFRSISIIKKILIKYNIPLRDSTNTYKNPPLLPLNSVHEDYNINDLVYSARYNTPAYITGLIEDSNNGKVYSIWLLGPNCKYAVQPYYELSSLVELQKLGVKITEMDSNDIKIIVNQAVLNANKGKKNDK